MEDYIYIINTWFIGTDSEILMMEEWLVKMLEVAEMTELTYLITERSTTIFISQWKPLMEFLLKNKNERLIYIFKG